MKKKVFISSDHAGFDAKEKLKSTLKNKYQMIDLGPKLFTKTDDYPDYAFKLAEKVSKSNSQGILICGSAVGMCIAANKVKGIRAVAAYDTKIAKLSREHNNANVLCLQGRNFPTLNARKIAETFLSTPFSNESRHLRRIKKISNYER